jgi:hypothetical protein
MGRYGRHFSALGLCFLAVALVRLIVYVVR